MQQQCLNCGHNIIDNFCGSCGQKKYKRIDKKYIWDELQYTFLHMNKGFLYSVKNILKNPGKTARQFIDGNRVNHYKPILLLFILSGISTFISFKILGMKEIMDLQFSKQKVNSAFMSDYLTFIKSYSSFITLLLIPFFALTTKIAFRKWGHNYYEHIVINSYILSFYTIISIVFMYPIMFLFRHSLPSVVVSISSYLMLIVPFMLTWFFKEFYPEQPLKRIIGKVLLILLLVVASFILLMIIAGIVGFIIAMIKGPEAMKYLKPQ